MHIPDGFISGEINAAAFVVSAAVCTLAVRRANQTLRDRQVPLLGTAAAFVFAAQMLNFPVGGGSSGHLLGALLSAVLLGPLNAFLVITLVLVLQCLLFADGGLTALGTNIFNIGVVGAIGCYGVFALLKSVLPARRETFLGAVFVCAWLSVVAGAAVCAVELALSGTSPLEVVLPAMVGVHAVIGIGEAMITTAVVSLVLSRRPDLVGSWSGEAPNVSSPESALESR